MATQDITLVRHLLELKERRVGKREVIWVAPDDLVITAQNKMWANQIRSVLVMEEGEGELKGILTLWDCLGKLELEHRLAVWTPVKEIMTLPPIETVVLQTTIEDAVARFERHRHLPVLEEGKVIDVVSDMDLIYALQTHKWNLEDLERGAMMHPS